MGLIAVLGLCLYNLSCLATIFFTPASGGNGDCYDATRDAESGVSITGVLLLLLPLLLVVYPWVKLFISMMSNRTRPDYYGLFVGNGMVTKLISVLLTILNVGSFTSIFFKSTFLVQKYILYPPSNNLSISLLRLSKFPL